MTDHNSPRRFPSLTHDNIIFCIAIGANTPVAVQRTFGSSVTLDDVSDLIADLVLAGRISMEPNAVRTLHLLRWAI